MTLRSVKGSHQRRSARWRDGRHFGIMLLLFPYLT